MCKSDDQWGEFTEKLLEAGIWLPTGVAGVYGRTHLFEQVVMAFEKLITNQASSDGAERVFFPPLMNRATLARTGYLQSFPELCGSVHSFSGSEREHADFLETVEGAGDWSSHLEQTELTLVPAACYPLYPMLTGKLPLDGRLFDLSSYVFRHEPSPDPARLQTFRMKENVRVGTAEDVEAWRAEWMQRGLAILESLGLVVNLEVANDPFFGRGGRMMAKNQTAAQLKFEITTQIFSDKPATAIASFNYHEDKFGQVFNIICESGESAHTACLGFGLERVTLALFKKYGLDPADWPDAVQKRLSI